MMGIKYILILFMVLNCVGLYSQNKLDKNWEYLRYKDLIHITVTAKTQKFKVDKYVFETTWDSKQNYSNNIGYYGGIKTMKIYKDNKLLNTIHKIPDSIALGEIYFNFHDYNFDGYIDFSVFVGSGRGVNNMYFLFNKELNQFKHYKDWGHIEITKFNKSKKQIKFYDPYNAMNGTMYKYQVSGYKLVLLETIEY